jgi:hypothetical protein
MSESDRIDWFNRLCFPKSNISLCGSFLKALRDKFFPGVSFDDVLKKMSGTMAEVRQRGLDGPGPRRKTKSLDVRGLGEDDFSN